MTKRAGTNGSVSIRATRPDDAACLLAGRDLESNRFLGEGDPDPHPEFWIEVFGQVVGWVDFDIDRTWLQPDEVNIGYNVFPAHRAPSSRSACSSITSRRTPTSPWRPC